MIKRSSNSVFYLSLIGLITLSGCLGSKKNEPSRSGIKPGDNSVVLLTIGGEPKITVNSLDAAVNELAEMDQQTKMLMIFDPEGTKERIFRQLKQLAVVGEWAAKAGVHQTAEYQEELSRILHHIQSQLDFKYFLDQHQVVVSDEDVKNYYDQNKDQDYRILIAPAGVKTQAVEFSTKALADSFAAKAKQAGAAEFEKVAKEQKLIARNLGNINDGSYADKEIKDAVLKLQKFPAILVIEDKDKNKCWVVAAQGQESAKYHDFDQIKDQISQMLTPKKIGEMLEVKVPEYSTQFGVVENTDYFDGLRKAKNANKKSDELAEQVDGDDLLSLDRPE